MRFVFLRSRRFVMLISCLLPLAAAAGEDWCAAIGKRLKSVPAAQCRALGLQAAPLKSAQGRALMLRDLPPAVQKLASQQHHKAAGAAGAAGRAPRVLVIGGIHGDELTSAALVFRWLPWMQDGEAGRYHWRVIPVANPDGLLAKKPMRVNANGVDLNRNFSTPDWNQDAHAYWQRKTERDPRRFPGHSARSENETRWLEGEIAQFAPDVIVSLHAPYGLLDYDGPARQPRRFGQLTLNRLGVYPGSLGNYGGVHKNVPVITIELPHANAMPPLREQREIWEDMLTWLRRNIVARS